VNDQQHIAALIGADLDLTPQKLLQQYLNTHGFVRCEPFQNFCADNGVLLESKEFIEVLEADKLHSYQEEEDQQGRCWYPVLAEGYVNNILPPDWSDDELAGINAPADPGEMAGSTPFECEPCLIGSDEIDMSDLPIEPSLEDEPDGPIDDLLDLNRDKPRRRPMTARGPGGVQAVESDVASGKLLIESKKSLPAAYQLLLTETKRQKTSGDKPLQFTRQQVIQIATAIKLASAALNAQT